MKINIIGLGEKNEDLSFRAYKKLKECSKVFVRSDKLLCAQFLKEEKIDFSSFDYIYEKAEDFDELNLNLAQELLAQSKEGEVCFLVDGSGTFDLSLKHLKGCDVEIFPACGKGSSCHGKFGEGQSISEISSYEFVERVNIGGILSSSLYIFDVDSEEIAREVKLSLNKIIDDEHSIIFAAKDGFKEMPLYMLDWEKNFDENTGVFIKFKPFEKKTVFTFTDLLDIMTRLRGDNGCPWDRAQTHMSIRQNLIEEAYELAEAIDLNDTNKIVEESGDVMLQAVLHSAIGFDMGEYDMEEVVSTLCRKLIDRHSYIFGLEKATTASEAIGLWDKNKLKEKGQDILKSIMDVPKTFPALLYAQKISKRAGKVGFDFCGFEDASIKVKEELQEVINAKNGDGDLFEECGDLLFASLNLVRVLGFDGELALTRASEKFVNRFKEMEQIAFSEGKKLEELSSEQYEEIYQQAKLNLKK